jgi:hypothetical protein
MGVKTRFLIQLSTADKDSKGFRSRFECRGSFSSACTAIHANEWHTLLRLVKRSLLTLILSLRASNGWN